jgi:RND superfamily putative drug exporter
VSTFLYTLGHLVARRRLRVLALWCFLTVVLFGIAGVFGGKMVNDYTIPGTESQRGIDTLSQRFPQASGTTGQIIFTANSGPVSAHQAEIEKQITAVGKVPHVSSVDDPFAKGAVGTISTSGQDALAQIQFDVSVTALPATTVPAVEKAAHPDAGAAYQVTLGGDMYSPTGVGISITELLGVVLAFVVLAITFCSLLAAGLPLLAAALGVGATMAGILTVASLTTISSTTPTLALMIGLAVGIDYGLFIVTRHRRQLADGLEVEESIARALATAGSAVVFAGTTVIIALCGLAVAQIPFLSVMGWAAAAGVAVAVCVALTLLPAVLAISGEKLRPKPKSKAARLYHAAREGKVTMGARWVALVTKLPALTVIVVLVGLAVVAYPAKDLTLALTDNGSAEAGSPERTAYDLVAKQFGPGYNSPLLVTADIITSTDPKGVVQSLADDIGKLDGVVAITKETPNQTADLGLVRVVPQWSQSDPRTTDLVQRIRARAGGWEKSLKISDIAVTGQTAVAIDVSSRLSGALVPFGIVVVGLALVLLAIVFRSVAVPLKATLGYLLSIGAALGAVSATFTWGWLAGPLSITLLGPVVSFLPIILMGVLFGLAMDYEVFLVSQMREDYVHGHEAGHAIRTGFTSSARVVTAAAIIMISVFAAFIPDGNATIKPIALGLAFGVFVDAFLVRMTLVPAILALLGDKAWWIPRWLDRALPVIDVEGQALVRHVAQVEWDEQHGPVAVRAEGAMLASATGPIPVDLSVPLGSLAIFEDPDPQLRSAFTWALAGRHSPSSGQLAVLGHVLPEEAALVRKRVRVITAPVPADDALTVRRYLSTTLLAQSKHVWSSPRATRHALQQADAWIREVGSSAAAGVPLARRQVISLGTLERRLVALSAVANQGIDLVIVDEADEDLGSTGLAQFSAICRRLVQTAGSSLILVGADLSSIADPPAPVRQADRVPPGPADAPEPAAGPPPAEGPTVESSPAVDEGQVAADPAPAEVLPTAASEPDDDHTDDHDHGDPDDAPRRAVDLSPEGAR